MRISDWSSDVCSSDLKTSPSTKQPTIHATVLPKGLKVVFGNDRLIDIRSELTKLKRSEFPNAGAVLLRVFFELSIMQYLDRTGELTRITKNLKDKGKIGSASCRERVCQYV